MRTRKEIHEDYEFTFQYVSINTEVRYEYYMSQ